VAETTAKGRLVEVPGTRLPVAATEDLIGSEPFEFAEGAEPDDPFGCLDWNTTFGGKAWRELELPAAGSGRCQIGLPPS
jgi:hypothetical protein